MTGVNIMITMTAVHFNLIITYHIITLICKKFEWPTKVYSQKIREWISKFHEKQETEHTQILLQNEVPEANRYYIYQESLLAPDYDN